MEDAILNSWPKNNEHRLDQAWWVSLKALAKLWYYDVAICDWPATMVIDKLQKLKLTYMLSAQNSVGQQKYNFISMIIFLIIYPISSHYISWLALKCYTARWFQSLWTIWVMKFPRYGQIKIFQTANQPCLAINFYTIQDAWETLSSSNRLPIK